MPVGKKFISGRTLQFEFYLPDNFGKKLILGLDMSDLKDLIIFHNITKI